MVDVKIVLRFIAELIIAFIGTYAFSYIFHVPKSQHIFTGLTGAAGWLGFSLASIFGVSITVSSFIGALVLTAVTRIFSFLRAEPITTFLFCGIFPIVPGAGIYYTAYYLFMEDNALGLSKGMETIKIAIAIALGIGIILSLPKFLFDYRHKPKTEAYK